MGVWWHALAFVTHERAKMSHKPGRNVTQAGPKCHTRAKMSHSHVIIQSNAVSHWLVANLETVLNVMYLYLSARLQFLTHCAVNNKYQKMAIHSGYSLVNINFAPISTCKNNQWMWCHNTSASHLFGITLQLSWHHSSRLEKTILGVKGSMNNKWLLSVCLCLQSIK